MCIVEVGDRGMSASREEQDPPIGKLAISNGHTPQTVVNRLRDPKFQRASTFTDVSCFYWAGELRMVGKKAPC